MPVVPALTLLNVISFPVPTFFDVTVLFAYKSNKLELVVVSTVPAV